MGGIARVSQVQLLQPFVTFALAAVFNDETITLQILLFAAAVVVTVAISTRTRAKTCRAARPSRVDASDAIASRLSWRHPDRSASDDSATNSARDLFRLDGAKQNPCGFQMIHLHAQLDDLAH